MPARSFSRSMVPTPSARRRAVAGSSMSRPLMASARSDWCRMRKSTVLSASSDRKFQPLDGAHALRQKARGRGIVHVAPAHGIGKIGLVPDEEIHGASRLVRRLRSEEHTSELQSLRHLVCRLLLDTATTEIYPLSLHDALPIYVAPAHGIGKIGLVPDEEIHGASRLVRRL